MYKPDPESPVPEGKVSIDGDSIQFLRDELRKNLLEADAPESVADKISANVKIRVICLADNVENAQNREFLASMAEQSTGYILNSAAEISAHEDLEDDDALADRILDGMSIELHELTKAEAAEMEAEGQVFTNMSVDGETIAHADVSPNKF